MKLKLESLIGLPDVDLALDVGSAIVDSPEGAILNHAEHLVVHKIEVCTFPDDVTGPLPHSGGDRGYNQSNKKQNDCHKCCK